MAYDDYLALRNAVVGHTGRHDLLNVMDELTKLAESRLNRTLRTADQITTTTLTISSGSATLPSDFLEMIGVYDGLGREYTEQTAGYAFQSGRGAFYSIEGGALKTNGADGTRDIKYYAEIPTITATLAGTNWLLAAYPAVYFHAVCAEVYKRAGEVESAAAHTALRDDEVGLAMGEDMARRYSRARVRVAGATP